MKNSLLLGAGLLLASVLAPDTSAQACIGPDNLQGPCCTPAIANLPAFPPASLPGMGICWGQCNPGAQPVVKVGISPPVMSACGEFQAQLSVTNAAGAPVLGGLLTLDYTRTWFEVAPVAPGGQYQVWRFVVKGDLNAPSAAAGCPTPSCIGPNPTAYFYGYIDYALDCITNQWSEAFVIYHGCDRFMHRPGLSFFPGVFHPGISYGVVAPVTAANPFVVAPNPFPSGPLMAEATREMNPIPGALLCETEERVVGGLHQFLGQGCACPLLPGPGMHSANFMNGSGSCPDPTGVPSNFQSLNIPGQPWLFDVKASIGMWTNPAGGFPGNEVVWVDEGVYSYHDSCNLTPIAMPTDWIEIQYGVATAKGFNVLPSDPGTILSDKFIDIASNYSTPATAPAPMPAVGRVLPTRHLIYVNVP